MLVQTLQRRLNFTTRDFGRLYIADNGQPEQFLAPATGYVDAPAEAAIKLKVAPEACHHLSELRDSELSAIEVLDFEGCTISGAQAEHLARMVNLRELNIRHCEISSASLSFLKNLKSLTTLRINWCPIGNVAVDHISKCPVLRVLDLSRTYIDAQALGKLGALAKLQEISLIDVNADAAEIASFQKQHPHLRVIH